MSTLLSLEHVFYQVEAKVILRDINLTVEPGANLTLTGPSGSGKSTILRIMAAMLTKTGGTLTFNGQPLESYDPIEYRRQVSYCFQQPTLFGETVQDNLAFPYQIRKQPFDVERAKHALDEVGLTTNIMTEPIGNLSGGERQRIALIRNILFLPRILLLDEVTAGLDAANRQIIHQLIQHLNLDQQVAIVAITHDEQEIQAAKQILWVEAGQLREGRP